MSNDDWALVHPLWPPGNQVECHHVIADMRSRLARPEDFLMELQRLHVVETTVIEVTLQCILTSAKDVLSYFHDNFL